MINAMQLCLMFHSGMITIYMNLSWKVLFGAHKFKISLDVDIYGRNIEFYSTTNLLPATTVIKLS